MNNASNDKITGGAAQVRTLEKNGTEVHPLEKELRATKLKLQQSESKRQHTESKLQHTESKLQQTQLKLQRSNLALVCVMEERDYLGLQAGGWKLVAQHYRGDDADN